MFIVDITPVRGSAFAWKDGAELTTGRVDLALDFPWAVASLTFRSDGKDVRRTVLFQIDAEFLFETLARGHTCVSLLVLAPMTSPLAGWAALRVSEVWLASKDEAPDTGKILVRAADGGELLTCWHERVAENVLGRTRLAKIGEK